MMLPPGIEYLEHIGIAVVWLMWLVFVVGLPVSLGVAVFRRFSNKTP